MKIAFLDRDGTLIFEPPNGEVTLENFKVLPGVAETLKKLTEQGYPLIVVSNQGSGATQESREEQFALTQQKLEDVLKNHGIAFSHVFMCPHTDDDHCACRKPKTGMVDELLRKSDIDVASSFMVGDRETDGMFAKNIGVRFFKMTPNGTFPSAVELLTLKE